MELLNININIADKHPLVEGTPVIVCGNSNYQITFTFDEEWAEATAKTARFVYVRHGEVKHRDLPFSGNTVEVPKLTDTKEVHVGVFAGDLITTTGAIIPCELSIRCGTGAPEDPTPDQYDQIMALLQSGSLQGPAGENGLTPYIGANGNWWIGETDTGKPSRGATGPAGESIVGPQGPAGESIVGPQGPAGESIVGPQGPAGSTPYIGANGNWWIDGTDTGKPSRGATGAQGPAGESIVGPQGQAGQNGITPHIGANGNWYVGSTDTGVKAQGDTGAKGDSGSVPPYAESLADCTDTTKLYLLPDGYLYAYVESTQMQEITEKIVGTSDNPFLEGNRISGGNIYNDVASITTTPYIDLLTSPSGHAFSAGDVVSVEFKGADYFPSSDLGSYYRTQFLKADKSYIKGGNTYQFKNYYPYHNAEWDADGTSRFTYTVGSGNGYDANIRYIRMCANNATEANSDISVTYTAEVTGYQWVNTGLKYSPTLTAAEKAEIAEQAAALIDAQLLSVIGDGAVTV